MLSWSAWLVVPHSCSAAEVQSAAEDPMWTCWKCAGLSCLPGDPCCTLQTMSCPHNAGLSLSRERQWVVERNRERRQQEKAPLVAAARGMMQVRAAMGGFGGR